MKQYLGIALVALGGFGIAYGLTHDPGVLSICLGVVGVAAGGLFFFFR